MKWFLIIYLFIMLSNSCATKHEVEVKPMEIKPIYITIDVNIRVDKALDNFFEDIDRAVQQADAPVKPSQP